MKTTPILLALSLVAALPVSALPFIPAEQPDAPRIDQKLPTLAGTWRGTDWGTVTLKQVSANTYEGTYTDTYGTAVGRIKLAWSQESKRFDGTWGEGTYRHGTISVRILPDRKGIRGAWTTDKSCEHRPGIPALSDLDWVAVPEKQPLRLTPFLKPEPPQAVAPEPA